MAKIKIFLIPLIFISTTLLAETNIFDKGIDFKEGIINYAVSGSETGTKTVYIKEYGKRRVIYANTKNKFMRKNQITDRVTHITPKWIYKINLKSNTTTKLHNLKYLLSQKFQKLSLVQKEKLEKNLQSLNGKSLLNLNGKLTPSTEKIVGYLYNNEVVQGISTCTAQNLDLVLKTEISILGFHSKTEAVQIEKKPVDYKIFILAENLTITPTPEKNQALKQKADQIIEYLLL